MSGYSRWMEKSFVAGTFPPHFVQAPTISGTGTVGQVLTATVPGVWLYSPSSYTYQWVRGPATNVGTNAATYTLAAGDSGFPVFCVVSAVNAAGTTLGPPSNPIRVA
jgi:hypothetical protein